MLLPQVRPEKLQSNRLNTNTPENKNLFIKQLKS